MWLLQEYFLNRYCAKRFLWWKIHWHLSVNITLQLTKGNAFQGSQLSSVVEVYWKRSTESPPKNRNFHSLPRNSINPIWFAQISEYLRQQLGRRPMSNYWALGYEKQALFSISERHTQGRSQDFSRGTPYFFYIVSPPPFPPPTPNLNIFLRCLY